eukprot:jgi/Ulvmu1/11747/UM008_0160.1
MSWRSAYGHLGRIFDLTVSPSGSRLLSASEDGSARVWSLDSAAITQEACVSGHDAEVMRASWNSDETLIATASADTTAKIWRLGEEYASKCVVELEGHKEELYYCEWVNNTEHVLTASGSELMLWDLSRQRRIARVMLKSSSVHKDMPELWRNLSIFSCTQHPTAPLAAAACSDGNVHVVSLQNASLQPLRMLPVAEALGGATMCSAAAFSAAGDQLAVGTRCGVVTVYCTSSWARLHTLQLPAAVMGCAWGSQERSPTVLIASGSAVKRWQPSTGTRSVLRSRWPERELLCVACRNTDGRDTVVASGEVVPAAPAAAEPPGAKGAGGGEGQGAGDVGGGLFAAGGLETTARRKRKARKPPAAVAGAAPGSGGVSALGVPSAVGRSPIELWGAEW